MVGMKGLTALTDNELQLIYQVTPRNSTPHDIHIHLIFKPHTRQLDDVKLKGTELDLSEVITTHIGKNDVQGLINAILARVRIGG